MEKTDKINLTLGYLGVFVGFLCMASLSPVNLLPGWTWK